MDEFSLSADIANVFISSDINFISEFSLCVASATRSDDSAIFLFNAFSF
jgi:hypothetical protein